MATLKNYLDYAGLTEYDSLIKIWANSTNQLAYKTVLKSLDGNNLLFFKKANAHIENPDPEDPSFIPDVPDVSIPLGNADIEAQLAALAAIVPGQYVHQDPSDPASPMVYEIQGLTTTETATLVGAINEVKADEPVDLMVLDTPTAGALKTYKLVQGTNTADVGDPDNRRVIGVIDIPKDFLVKSGKVVTITNEVDSDGDTCTGYADGTYIKLIINVKEDPTDPASIPDERIYINVATLVDIYHGAANASEVQITVGNVTTSDPYEISAAVVDVIGTKITYKPEYTDETDPEHPVTVPRESVTDALNNIQSIPQAQIDALFT